jgi:hypothetical protein
MWSQVSTNKVVGAIWPNDPPTGMRGATRRSASRLGLIFAFPLHPLIPIRNTVLGNIGKGLLWATCWRR